jgi:hypothetical protein
MPKDFCQKASLLKITHIPSFSWNKRRIIPKQTKYKYSQIFESKNTECDERSINFLKMLDIQSIRFMITFNQDKLIVTLNFQIPNRDSCKKWLKENIELFLICLGRKGAVVTKYQLNHYLWDCPLRNQNIISNHSIIDRSFQSLGKIVFR